MIPVLKVIFLQAANCNDLSTGDICLYFGVLVIDLTKVFKNYLKLQEASCRNASMKRVSVVETAGDQGIN